MLSADKARAGKHGRADEQANRLSHDAVKLLKSQDAGYLRVVAGIGRREIGKLEEVVGMSMAQGGGKKILFVDDDVMTEIMHGSAGKREGLDNQGAGDLEGKDEGSGLGPENLGLKIDTTRQPDLAEASALSTASRKSKKAIAAEHDAMRELRAARKRRKRVAELRIRKLEALKKRQREVMAAADELDLQRAKMARTVGGVNKDGVKWRIRERKR